MGAKYRLYVDEVGNSDLRSSINPNHRYLSLTGVVIDLQYVQEVVYPEIERIKRNLFGSHPDDPIIFHRKEILNKKYPFEALRDKKIEALFNEEILTCLRDFDYMAITVVMDKLEHERRYSVWHYDPYHYCLQVLVERYVLWLNRKGVVGDVMAESRGGKEDVRLKKSYNRVWEKGSDYVPHQKFAECLTSGQLKVKPKTNNISGLQIADLIAHPSFKSVLARRNNKPLPKNFGGEIANILEKQKYYRDDSGKIDGWGRKWLP